MANFGHFFGGFSQGINSGLSILMQKQQQEQQMALEQQKMELAQKQAEAKARTEDQAAQLKSVTSGVDTLTKANPEQVGPFVAGWIARYQKQYGEMSPTLINALKRDPQGVLGVLNNADPDEVRTVIGNENAFLELWPKLATATAQGKANRMINESLASTPKPDGRAEIDRRIADREALVQKLINAGAPQASIDAAAGELDKLRKDRGEFARSPTAQGTLGAGFDPSGALTPEAAQAAQQRDLQLGQQKAYGEAQARTEGQWAGGRLSMPEAAELGVPLFTPNTQLAPGGAGVGAGGIIPQSNQQKQMSMRSFESVMKTAETDRDNAQKARVDLATTDNILKVIDRLGPNITGGGWLSAQRGLIKFLSPQGAEASDLQSLDALRTWKAIKHARALAPVSDNDFAKIASSQGGEELSLAANKEVLKAIRREEQRAAALDKISNAFIEGRMGKDIPYSTRRAQVLDALEKKFAKEDKAYKAQTFGEGGPPPKPQAAAPAATQKGVGAGKPTSGGPVWRRFEPAVQQAIAEQPPQLQRVLSAVAEIESGGRANAKAPNSNATGAFQIIPRYMKDWGLPNLPTINDPNNPREAARWTGAVMEGLLDKYEGNKVLALAAYNQGMGVVDKYVREKRKGGMGKISPALEAKYQEGLKYAKKVINVYNKTPAITQEFPPPMTAEKEALGSMADLVPGFGRVPNEAARSAGRVGVETLAARGGQALLGGFGILGKGAGAAFGAMGGAVLSETFDPTRDPKLEVVKAGLASVAGELLVGIARKVIPPAALSEEGAVYFDMITRADHNKKIKQLMASKGLTEAQAAAAIAKDKTISELILPGSASANKLLQNVQQMGAQSALFGERIQLKKDAANRALQGFGDDYAGKLLMEKAVGQQKYKAFDAVSNAPVDLTIASGVTRAIRNSYGARLEGTVLVPPGFVSALNKVDELRSAQMAGKKISFNEMQGVQQDLWTVWQGLHNVDNKAAADIVKIIKATDASMEATARKAGSKAYDLYKEANAHYKLAGQGTIMETMLTKARVGQTGDDTLGFIDPTKLLNQLTDTNLAKLPYKLSPEHVSFMRDLAIAMKQNAGKEGWMRVMAMGAEYGGAAGLATGAFTGMSLGGMAIKSMITLTPSTLAVLATNPTAKRLILEGIKVKPGTGEAFNVATKLGVLLANELGMPPLRVDKNEQQRNYFSPSP